MDKMADKEAIDLLTQAVQARGHYSHICPEALEDLMDYSKAWGWNGIVNDVPGWKLRMAFNQFMDSMGALLAPL